MVEQVGSQPNVRQSQVSVEFVLQFGTGVAMSQVAAEIVVPFVAEANFFRRRIGR